MKQSMNFEHIQKKWPQLHQLAAFAEEYAIDDPQSSLVKLRCFAEQVVGYLYKELRLPVFPNSTIYDKLTSDDFTSIVPRLITDKLHAIRKSGNQAAHQGQVDQQQAIWILKESYFIACYLFMAYDNCTQRAFKKDLNTIPIDINAGIPLYQMETITDVCERFAKKYRKSRIVQATDTGKTLVSIALAKHLLDAGWTKRVLHLRCFSRQLSPYL